MQQLLPGATTLPARPSNSADWTQQQLAAAAAAACFRRLKWMWSA
jgi:hypothetical protein